MPKKKSETKQSTTSGYENKADYGWENVPNTPDIDAYRNYRPEIDPSISFGAAASRNRSNSSFINPLGGYMTPSMRDKLQAAGNRQIDQDASQAFRQGQYDVNQQRGGQLANLAALTSSRLVQKGSSGTSQGEGKASTVQGNNLFGDILEIAQGAGGIAMG